jgi:hypothetical protein
VRFALASERDDAAIRQLLRASPMRGDISLSFEREPGYFLGCGVAGAEDRTIVAFEHGRLVCMGRCSVRTRFLNGQPCRVGYLGELRLDASVQGRFDILRRGYQFFREVYGHNPPAAWFTSIASDNQRSIRFLERNLAGLPRYEFLDEFVTLLLPVPKREVAASRLGHIAAGSLEERGLKLASADEVKSASLVSLLNLCGEQRQFPVVWTAEHLLELRRFGLPLADVQSVLDGVRPVACAAIWDQRSFRQTIIQGYSRKLSVARPVINLAATALGVAGLPAVGSIFAHAFLSPVAIAPGREESLFPLVECSLALARPRNLDYLTLGCTVGDPILVRLRKRFRCREYRSRLYRVAWPGEKESVVFDGRPLAPEVGLL